MCALPGQGALAERFPVSPLWGAQSRLYSESAGGRMRRLWVPVFGDRRNHFSQDPGSPHRVVLGDLSYGPGPERDFRYATEQGDRGLLSHGLVAAARKPRDGFRPIRSGSETFHRDRHHRLGFGSSSLLGIPLFGSARIAFIDFDEATQLITLIAVGHGLANLGKSGSSCFR
jgi:hypothetical protein